jgi:hypothetical protein
MLHRFSILMILASWLFAWSSATVHIHHGYDCSHAFSASVSHVHGVRSHGHCHNHGEYVHSQSAVSESTGEGGDEERPSVSGDCPLCDLTAMELSATPFVGMAPSVVCVDSVSLPQVASPTVVARYSLRGRAPPAS